MVEERWDELKSDPIDETTAVTMQSIKEILEESGDIDLLLSDDASRKAKLWAFVSRLRARLFGRG